VKRKDVMKDGILFPWYTMNLSFNNSLHVLIALNVTIKEFNGVEVIIALCVLNLLEFVLALKEGKSINT
jgi:hypothetical protein